MIPNRESLDRMYDKGYRYVLRLGGGMPIQPLCFKTVSDIASILRTQYPDYHAAGIHEIKRTNP